MSDPGRAYSPEPFKFAAEMALVAEAKVGSDLFYAKEGTVEQFRSTLHLQLHNVLLRSKGGFRLEEMTEVPAREVDLLRQLADG
jgi:hypothetical protein